jgi:small subunit ribosomal protein S13
LPGEFRPIVRLAGRDLNGYKRVAVALKDIKGVNIGLANAIANQLKIESKSRLGQLSDAQIAELEKAVRDPRTAGVPVWMFNRRKDVDTGEDHHLLESDLAFSVKGDIDRAKVAGSWKGVRHSLGLKVRGQRTRTTGRKGATVGVRKAAVQAAAHAAAEAAKKE